MMSGGNQWRLYVFIGRFYQLRRVKLSVPRSALVSRQGGYERTWSQVRIHLDLHRPRARTNVAQEDAISRRPS